MISEYEIVSGSYCWTTDESHFDNMETMSDFLNNELPDEFKLIVVDGTYAEIEMDDDKYEVHVSGNGDSFSHKAELSLLVPF